MQTKVIDKIVLSESAPSNKNVAWLKPSTEGGGLSLKVYKDQEWSKVETTSSSEGDGGGSTPDTPSGGSNWRYWRVDNTAGAFQLLASMMMVKVKGYPKLEDMTGNGDAIIPPAMFSMLGGEITYSAIKAMASDISKKVVQGGFELAVGDAILQNPNFEYLTEITEAEFYSLD